MGNKTGRGIEWEERDVAQKALLRWQATPREGTLPHVFLLHKECFGLVSLPTTSHNAFELSAGHSRWKQIGITIDYGFRCVDRRGSVILHKQHRLTVAAFRAFVGEEGPTMCGLVDLMLHASIFAVA